MTDRELADQAIAALKATTISYPDWKRRVDQGKYADQKPMLFLWLGGYESEGLTSVARMTQTLDRRGRTLAEALADVPVFGSVAHSFSTGGTPDSSVVKA